jgi:hypothetical protein
MDNFVWWHRLRRHKVERSDHYSKNSWTAKGDCADELAAGPRRAGYEHARDKISLIASWPAGVSAKNFFRP